MASRILRVKDILGRFPISERTLYRMIKTGSFPKPIAISARLVGWPEEVYEAWEASLIEDSRVDGRVPLTAPTQISQLNK